MSAAPELSSASTVRPREGVLAREVGGEMVVLDVDQGVYYGLNEVATRAWALWLEGRPLGEVEASLGADYDASRDVIHADLLALVRDLAEHGLIDVAPG